MSRPRKCRRICRLPETTLFEPSGCKQGKEIVMTVDEFETIRWIDLEGVTQENCAARMNVARTTVQAIYTSAREKLAKALVFGRPLRISGGDYVLCQGDAPGCSDSSFEDQMCEKQMPRQGCAHRHCAKRHELYLRETGNVIDI